MTRILAIAAFLSCFIGTTNGQTMESQVVSIDHVPIVVKDLDQLTKILSESFQFKVKEGREHAGIKNCFIKFRDGTYLEFVTPVDTLQAMGKYYARFLKNRSGATALAIAVNHSDSVIHYLNEKSISHTVDSNRIWKTIEPLNSDLFFIDYSDKQWKDSEINTTHPNTAISLKSTYMLSLHPEEDANRYQTYGFKVLENGTFQSIPSKHLMIGNSHLYLLAERRSTHNNESIQEQSSSGICGFEIRVSSLDELNQHLQKTENVQVEEKQTIVYLTDIKLFLVFTE